MSNNKYTDLLARLDDLIVQATKERSHYYVKAVATLAAAALRELQAENARLHSELQRGFLEVCVEPSIKYFMERAERAEAERDAAIKERDALQCVINTAAGIMHGNGVEDQGEAWDKALHLLDAALKEGK